MIRHHSTNGLDKKDVTSPQLFCTLCTFGPLRSWTWFQIMLSTIWSHYIVLTGVISSLNIVRKPWNLFSVFVNVFSLNSFEDVESKTFISRLFVGWTGTELSSPQLSSFPGPSASSLSRPRENRLRRNGAPLNGAVRLRGGCSASALERGCGGCQEQWWPGASSDGKEGQKSHLQWGTSKKRFGFEFWGKCLRFWQNVWQSRSFPPQNMLEYVWERVISRFSGNVWPNPGFDIILLPNAFIRIWLSGGQQKDGK